MDDTKVHKIASDIEQLILRKMDKQVPPTSGESLRQFTLSLILSEMRHLLADTNTIRE